MGSTLEASVTTTTPVNPLAQQCGRPGVIVVMGRLFQIARTSSAGCASLDWLEREFPLGSERAEATQDGSARTFRSRITTLPTSANATVTTLAALVFRLIAPASAVHAGSLFAVCANWI